MNTISVIGSATLNVTPDTTVVSMNLKNIKRTYEEALASSASEVNTIKRLIIKRGFNKDDLKTTYYYVDAKNESYKDKDGSYKSRFIGYEYSQTLEFSFANNNVLLGKILYDIGQSGLNSNIRLKFIKKDTNIMKNELLKNCVADAQNKAEILSFASNVKIKGIKSIDYGDTDYCFSTRSYEMDDCVTDELCSSSYEVDINPADINLSDTVRITWEIE